MKKFTSLFALLSCLCVVSAQADVTIYVHPNKPSANPKIHWWGNGEDFNKPLTDFNTAIFNDVTYFVVPLTANENQRVNVQFDGNGWTSDQGITGLVSGDYYYTYLGGTNFTAAIVTVGIAGPFNGWNTTTDKFTLENGVWTYILQPQNESDVEFKITPNGYWSGKTNPNNSASPKDWFEEGELGNFKLNHSKHSKEYSAYKLTASWNASWYADQGWSITAEGIANNQYTVGSTTYTIGETNNLDLSSDLPFSTTTSFTASTATYSRSTGNNHWGTLCLPFEIKGTYSGVTFFELSSVSSTAVTFTPISGTIAAGTPVAFKLTEPGTLTINESNVDVVAEPQTSGTGLTMKGTYQEKTLSSIYLIYNDEVRPGTNITIPPYRAWFEGTIPSSTGAPLRIEVADTEGLEFVEQEDGTVKAYFDLQGRKLDGARKGLIIENGKIIMVK